MSSSLNSHRAQEDFKRQTAPTIIHIQPTGAVLHSTSYSRRLLLSTSASSMMMMPMLLLLVLLLLFLLLLVMMLLVVLLVVVVVAIATPDTIIKQLVLCSNGNSGIRFCRRDSYRESLRRFPNYRRRMAAYWDTHRHT